MREDLSRRKIIKIHNERIYYTNTDFIAVKNTNFPNGKTEFKEKVIYWEVEVLEFDKNSKSLIVKLFNLNPINYEALNSQLKNGTVNYIKFENLKPYINWCGGQKYSASSVSFEKRDSLQPKPPQNSALNLSSIKRGFSKENSITKKVYTEEIPIRLTIKKENLVEFKYYFNDAEFKDGVVCVQQKFDFLHNKIELKIFNSEIRSEYNYVRNYFPKIFNNKKFTVTAKITTEDGKVVEVLANSYEIEKINEEIIIAIKEERTLKVTKLYFEEDSSQSLFTADEILSKIDEKEKGGNIFKQDEEDIIKTLINFKDIRSEKQLQYLAGLKHNKNLKVQFTLKPIFGFLFFIEGENNNHFCWELLKTHATYLWSFDKSQPPSKQLKRIEETINYIREIGRNKYKSFKRKDVIDVDIKFNVIEHKSIELENSDSFVIWKAKLNEYLK